MDSFQYDFKFIVHLGVPESYHLPPVLGEPLTPRCVLPLRTKMAFSVQFDN